MPSPRKAKYVEYYVKDVAEDDIKPPSASELEKVLKIKLNVGDIVNFGDYRQSGCYFVGGSDEHRVMVKNPDNSGSGYLTIPMVISKKFPNVLSHYSNVITKLDNQITDVEIPNEDVMINKLFKESEIKNNAYFAYYPLENQLIVRYKRKMMMVDLTMDQKFKKDNQKSIEKFFGLGTPTPQVGIVMNDSPPKKPKNLKNKLKSLFARKKN